jgi:hypothetical protein
MRLSARRQGGAIIAWVKITDDGGASPQLVPLTGTGD